MVLWPIHQKYEIKKLIVSTYQASSGAGAEGMDELLKGTEAKLKNEDYKHTVFAHPLPFNLIPHIDKFQENGYTKEEMKVVWETLKIFGATQDQLKACSIFFMKHLFSLINRLCSDRFHVPRFEFLF